MAGWAALAGGCAAPVGTAATATASTTTTTGKTIPSSSQSDADQRFVLAPGLERFLQVVSVRSTRPPGAFLKIQINLRNKTEQSQWFHYRIDWFDEDGTRLPQGGWELTPWMLLPNEMSSIVATSPTRTAVDFGIAFLPDGKQ
jgi:hypothetical protein